MYTSPDFGNVSSWNLVFCIFVYYRGCLRSQDGSGGRNGPRPARYWARPRVGVGSVASFLGDFILPRSEKSWAKTGKAGHHSKTDAAFLVTDDHWIWHRDAGRRGRQLLGSLAKA